MTTFEIKRCFQSLPFVASLLYGFFLQGQTLSKGDQLPGFSIPAIIHGPQSSAHTSEFKDKLLIIDFWSTTCSGCVAALPKMEALQKEFGNQVKVLPVTYETREVVDSFWPKNHYTRDLTIPTVVEDKQFHACFSHTVIPHEVWVYKGKVIGITEPEYVDQENIRKVLTGDIPDWPLKDDYYRLDLQNAPLFKPDPNQIDVRSTSLEYSAICDYLEDQGRSAGGTYGMMGLARDSVKKTVRIFNINYPIFTIYNMYLMQASRGTKLVKPDGVSIAPNEIVWDVNDPTRYMPENANFTPQLKTGYYGDWCRRNAICFEAQYPDKGQDQAAIARAAIADLDRLLGLKVRWENLTEKVWVLVKGKPVAAPRKEASVDGPPISAVSYYLNRNPKNPYVFDESGADPDLRLDIKLSEESDLQVVRKSLQRLGFDLKGEQRRVDKLIFSEVKGGLLVDPRMVRTAKQRRRAQKDMKNPSAEENAAFMEENRKKEGVVSLPSGLQYKILLQGNGIRPGLNDKVSVYYAGMLVNGKIFESSHEGGIPLELPVETLIKGWQEALQLMPEGSKWVLYVPANLAYGEHTNNGKLPRNSNLIFELELLKVIKPNGDNK
ncbi:FKBP-type peptidyl-prolyl cis-trans isomerase [Pararcticibacter amylolyticus]|uniref:peptidylprolyl isomerase n=1 Tax=Pararcticibacter amylolyticus TaxID=2173175 RepID=A0A2U2PFL4_9SPHI|nr:FKBP-type peptidyl-prolyl cis-trans isomerase [Pararcticibacter amylolyticus]PWG80197.1 hypothetical protein DDR33_13470 [Pararcticibacter amylolyticus]